MANATLAVATQAVKVALSGTEFVALGAARLVRTLRFCQWQNMHPRCLRPIVQSNTVAMPTYAFVSRHSEWLKLASMQSCMDLWR